MMIPRMADWEKNRCGIRKPVESLEALISRVIVAPEAQDWFYDLVTDVTRRYGLSSVRLERSKLTYLPGVRQIAS